MSCFIGSFIFAAKLFRNSTENFRAFNMIRLILGQTIPFKPRKIKNRIIFLTIVVAFVWINVNDFYENIIDIQYDRWNFKSYEDLEKSQLPSFATFWKGYKLEQDERFSKIVNKMMSLPVTNA